MERSKGDVLAFEFGVGGVNGEGGGGGVDGDGGAVLEGEGDGVEGAELVAKVDPEGASFADIDAQEDLIEVVEGGDGAGVFGGAEGFYEHDLGGDLGHVEEGFEEGEVVAGASAPDPGGLGGEDAFVVGVNAVADEVVEGADEGGFGGGRVGRGLLGGVGAGFIEERGHGWGGAGEAGEAVEVVALDVFEAGAVVHFDGGDEVEAGGAEGFGAGGSISVMR
jgi:hypothetical protein